MSAEINVLVIDSYDDLMNLKQEYGISNSPDWDKIQQDFDAVYLTEAGNNVNKHLASHHEFNIGLWDMSSMVVFKKSSEKLSVFFTISWCGCVNDVHIFPLCAAYDIRK